MGQRFLFLGFLGGLVACGSRTTAQEDPPLRAETSATAGQQKAMPPHDFAAMGDDGEAAYKGTIGHVRALIDGNASHLPSLPYGGNAYVVSPDGKISRLTITAEGSNNGYPRLQIYLYGVNLETAQLPVNFQTKREPERIVEMRYWKDETHSYRCEPGAGQVVLGAFDGKKINGSFAGTLKADKDGAPVRFADGEFAVMLRVSGSGQNAPKPAP